MRKIIIVETVEEFENLEIEYNLEDCGMSGSHPDCHWYADDDAKVDIYVPNKIYTN